MSRHRTALRDYDGYYDDDYYDEDYEDDYYPPSASSSSASASAAKSSSSTSKGSKTISSSSSSSLGDYVQVKKTQGNIKNQKKKQGTQSGTQAVAASSHSGGRSISVQANKISVPTGSAAQQEFIRQAREVFETKLPDDELIDIFTRSNGNTERAMSALIERFSNSAAAPPPVASYVPDAPPGLSRDDSSTNKLAKPPTPSRGVTVLSKQSQQVKSIRSTESSTPSKPLVSGHSSSPVSLKLPPTPPSVTRTNSGQLNRMSALSDDDLDESELSHLVTALHHLTMVVAGHVDAGKSTLVGNLLVKIGQIQSRVVHKYERSAQAQGKGSFYLAWVMDESESEREHGVTIGIAERCVTLRTTNYSLYQTFSNICL
jgi:hypothetical protein